MLGLADQAAGPVAAGGEQAQQLERDLPVASGDNDVHRSQAIAAGAAPLRRRAGG